MQFLSEILNKTQNGYISTSTIVSVLIVVTVLSVFEYMIYALVTKRSLYNKSFNIAIVILPYFISTIILSLQSNIVITLGTIGALAIIRFRTAIKDPVDMVYLLWSIHSGIMAGCQLYKVAALTSVIVTIALIIFTNANFLTSKKEFTLAISTDNENVIEDIFKNAGINKYKIISRNFLNNTSNYIIDFKTENIKAFSEALKTCSSVKKFSILSHEEEGII